MKKSVVKKHEWWVSLATNAIDLNAGGIAKDLAKLLGNEDKNIQEQISYHYNENIKQVDTYKLKINKKLTLQNIYVSPSATLKEIGSGKECIEIEPLIPYIVKLLNKSTIPIIIHGQPGHGKTSAMRIIARALTTNYPQKAIDRPLVLFYEFKDLNNLENNEFTILKRVTPFTNDKEFFIGRDSIIILDGMDERMISGDNRGFANFLRHIFDLHEKINQDSASSLKLILTGRSRFVNDIKGNFPDKYSLIEISDFNEEQLNFWLTKFNRITNNELIATELDERHLKDLKTQPVLLTICATMLTDSHGKELFRKKKQGVPFNREQVYEKIIKWTFNDKSHKNEDWTLEEYHSFLHAVGFVLFAQSQGNMTISKLETELCKIKELFEPSPLKKDILGELQTLSICFYFSGDTNNSFAFIHKSIQDYLVSMAIIHGIRNTIETFKPKRPESSCQKMAQDIYLLLGQQNIVPEDHHEFLYQKLKIETKLIPEILNALIPFLGYTIEHNYLLKSQDKITSDPIRTEAMVLHNLCYFTNICFNVLKDNNNLTDDLIQQYTNIWSTEKIEQVNYLLHCYSFQLHLAPVKFSEILDSNKFRLFLENIYFQEAGLNGAYLEDANLTVANLAEANLAEAKLTKVKLTSAYLKSAKFTRADLTKADFTGANLSGADFKSAKLTKAVLKNAKLEGTDLTGANLSGADFTGTNLSGAKLIEAANLKKANCKDAFFLEISDTERKTIISSLKVQKNIDYEKKIRFFLCCDNTTFPESFNPKKYGMINIGEYYQKHKTLPPIVLKWL